MLREIEEKMAEEKSYTRRQLMRRGIQAGYIGAGAVGGYSGARMAAHLVGMSLEATIGQLADFQLDILHELTGSIEKRLEKSVTDVEHYLGQTEEEYKVLSQYWDRLGLISEEKFLQLQRSLERAESYVGESDLGERLRRMKDRLDKRFIAYDSGVESRYPSRLRRFNDWFSKSFKGERGSREAGKEYKKRLDTLVAIYDVNQDTMIAQSHLLTQAGKTFADAQKEVVRHIDSYLQSDKITDVEEKQFYLGLKELAAEDASGNKLADYLLNTGNYYSSLQASDKLKEFQTTLHGIVDELSSVQEIQDQGIEIKNRVRKKGESDLERMSQKAIEFTEFVERKKEELEQKGYKIDYNASKLEALKEAVSDKIRTIGEGLSYIGAAGGAGVGIWLARQVPGGRYSRRAFLRLRRENEELIENRKLYKEKKDENTGAKDHD